MTGAGTFFKIQGFAVNVEENKQRNENRKGDFYRAVSSE